MATIKLDKLLADLQEYQSGIDTFNPWSDYDPIYDRDEHSPTIRSQQLKAYLIHRIHQAKYILVAEAVGYQGGKFSGVPMTSERILLGNQSAISPELIVPGFQFSRTSSPETAPAQTIAQHGYVEPTATIVWGLLQDLPISPNEIILWNIFPFHPFRVEEGALTNRTPRMEELAIGLDFFNQLVGICPPQVKIIAIGEKSAQTLTLAHNKVRHPANGGATQFREELPPLLLAQ